MNKAIIGKKLGMSQIFTEEGIVIPVTVVEAGPCYVTQVKTIDRDGYEAVQIAFGDVKEKNVNKPMLGQFKKANVAPKRYLKEFKFSNCADYQVGQEIKCDVFANGDKVDVVGTSKGHGYSGTIKRWNASCGPMAHGSKFHRAPGSLSACSSPSRVFKNHKMPGHYGADTTTMQNLTVAKVDSDRNLLLIKGGIPGPKGGMVVVKQSIKG